MYNILSYLYVWLKDEEWTDLVSSPIIQCVLKLFRSITITTQDRLMQFCWMLVINGVRSRGSLFSGGRWFTWFSHLATQTRVTVTDQRNSWLFLLFSITPFSKWFFFQASILQWQYTLLIFHHQFARIFALYPRPYYWIENTFRRGNKNFELKKTT